MWKYLEGGSFLVGPVDMFGNLTGDKIIYVYPDFQCAMTGSFTKGQVTVGQFCYVTGVRMHRGQLPEISHSTPKVKP